MVECRCRSNYVTRYRIDHEEQTSKLCSGVTMEEFFPCCPCGDEEEGEEEQLTLSWFWYLMTSELLLFLLHVIALIFGVIKVRLYRLTSH